MVQVHKRAGDVWADVLLGRQTMVLLQRLVFSRSASIILPIAGFNVERKYTLAGIALKILGSIRFENVLRAPAPATLWVEKRFTAFALILCAAAMALDYDAEQALRGIIRGRAQAVGMRTVEKIQCHILNWQHHSRSAGN